MLIGAMVASMAACGNNGGDKGGTKDNDTSAANEADGGASEGGDTLTVWTWDPKFNIPAIEEAGNIYKADHPDFMRHFSSFSMRRTWRLTSAPLTR